MSYWKGEGIRDKLEGYPPKTEGFFTTWFGEAGVRLYEAYIAEYRSVSRSRSGLEKIVERLNVH